MSATKTQNNQHDKSGGITMKDMISWGIGVGILVLGGWIGMKKNEATLDAKFNAYQSNTEKSLDRHEDALNKMDTKLDDISAGINEIKLQLKDKQDRK